MSEKKVYSVGTPKGEPDGSKVPPPAREDYEKDTPIPHAVSRALQQSVGDLPPELVAAMGLSAGETKQETFSNEAKEAPARMYPTSMQEADKPKENAIYKDPVPQPILDVVAGTVTIDDPVARFDDAQGTWIIRHEGNGRWRINPPGGGIPYMRDGVEWGIHHIKPIPAAGSGTLMKDYQEGIAKRMHTDEKYNVLAMQQKELLIIAEKSGLAPGDISDGYHTFNELYLHRTFLIAAWFCTIYYDAVRHGNTIPVWRSKKHSDGTMYDKMFIVGLHQAHGHQISYHMEMAHWELFDFCRTFDKAPEFDGHTPEEVLKRIRKMIP